MSEAVRGIIHVHSDFSRDGLHSVADLADFAREAGFQFVGLTDHAEDLSSEDMKSLRQECEEHSDESFVMIPGLEFRCDEEIHILGLGIKNHISSTDPVTVTSHIQELGGLAILAHPGRNAYQCPRELYTMLNGIEIWNAAYDGQFVPPLASLRLLQEAQTVNPAISAFGGVDLHCLDRSPEVVLHLCRNGPMRIDAQTVLQYLVSGKFAVRGKYVRIEAQDLNGPRVSFSLWALRKLYGLSTKLRAVILGGA